MKIKKLAMRVQVMSSVLIEEFALLESNLVVFPFSRVPKCDQEYS